MGLGPMHIKAFIMFRDEGKLDEQSQQNKIKWNKANFSISSPSSCIHITNIPWDFVFNIPRKEDITIKNPHLHKYYTLVKGNIENMTYSNIESDVLW